MKVAFYSALALVFVTAATALCPGANTPIKAALVSGAKAVLDGNWVPTMNSTLPSPNLYPHQWSWDAAFVAMGYSHYDTQKAIDETDALFRGQWRNGHIPHIVFNPSAVESYFPGPSFWRIETAGERGPLNPTSGITQPPVHALASLSIYENAPDKESKKLAYAHLEDVYPKLRAWHNYLYRERDPFKRDLVFIRHMWESGMDNSPAWDPVLASMKLKEGDVPEYKRVDKGKVGDHNERPDNFFYDRAVHLIKIFYDNNYDEAKIAEKSPFLIEDVLFNSILARAGHCLSRIAQILGKAKDEIDEIENQSDRTAHALSEKLFDDKDGYFYNYDLVGKRYIKTRISGGIAGVYGAKMTAKQVEHLVEHLYDPAILGPDLSSWTIPSVARDDPGFTNTTYWKGPAWINVNYLVRDGLLRNAGNNKDAKKIAKYLKERSLELIQKSGFYEYFHPYTGTPHGGHQFSWSASLAIDWICGAAIDDEPIYSNVLRNVGIVVFIIISIYLTVYSLSKNIFANRSSQSQSILLDHANVDDSAPIDNKAVDNDVLNRGNLRLRRTTRSGDHQRQ